MHDYHDTCMHQWTHQGVKIWTCHKAIGHTDAHDHPPIEKVREAYFAHEGKLTMSFPTDKEIEKQVIAEGSHSWDCQCGVHEWNEEENQSYKEAMDRNRV